MRVNALIIDDFYSNPEEVREFALEQEFKVRGNYPGMRTEPFANEDIKETIESIIAPFAGKITRWHTEYTGCFQYTTAYDRSWIHADSWNDWAGVLYLTPNGREKYSVLSYTSPLITSASVSLGIKSSGRMLSVTPFICKVSKLFILPPSAERDHLPLPLE